MSKNFISKPWGSEELIEVNENYVVKKLYMKKGHQCSLQYHENKHETVYVLDGEIKLTVGDSIDDLDFKANPRWPLDKNAKFLKGAGVKL